MHHFQVRNGEMHCEGVPLRRIAGDVGTPVYVYSHATLSHHYRVFDEAFGGIPHIICFSMKSNSNGSVIRTFTALGSGVDIVSGGELARALAATLFDDEANMIRIDMSEYMEKHTVARLIGAPPGYVGYEEGGQLTEAVRRRPFSVILFDEVEKAHHDVFNVLLQVLDDGRLTDSQGRTVDFKNTVLIMTSNIGSPQILEAQQKGSSYEDVRSVVIAELRRHFRPEFLNRVDETVVFHPLETDQLTKIVEIQLERLRARLAERRISLVVSPPALRYLGERGYDPVYGARPLKRLIQQELETPIARQLVKGELRDGDTATVDVKKDGLVIVPTVTKP